MKFVVEKKGEKYLVVNDTTGQSKGVHSTEGQAKLQASDLNKKFATAMGHIGSVPLPKESEDDLEDDGE